MKTSTTQVIIGVVASAMSCACLAVLMLLTWTWWFPGGTPEDPAYAGLPTAPPALRNPELQRMAKDVFAARCPCRNFNVWARVMFPAMLVELDKADRNGTAGTVAVESVFPFDMPCPAGTLVTDGSGKRTVGVFLSALMSTLSLSKSAMSAMKEARIARTLKPTKKAGPAPVSVSKTPPPFTQTLPVYALR